MPYADCLVGRNSAICGKPKPPPKMQNTTFFRTTSPPFHAHVRPGLRSGSFTPLSREAKNRVSTLANQNIRLPGQEYDGANGLYQNGFRNYGGKSPNIPRYIQADPIGLLGGMNIYQYVGGNPFKRIDLWGLDDLNWLPPTVVPWVTDPSMQNPQTVLGNHNYYNLNNPQGVFSIAAHGGWYNNMPVIYSSSGRPITADALAAILKYLGYKSGQAVLLDSCNTGAGGANSFAAQLAQKLNAPVVAPNGDEWSHWKFNGDQPSQISSILPPTVGPTPNDTSGHFIRFDPNGSSANVAYPPQQ